MKIIRAKVTHYRRIEEREIYFDDGITIVSGTNECGKSTFVEAMAAGLFLSSKITGDTVDCMRDWENHDPSVEVELEDNGHTAIVRKTFAGKAKGSSTSFLLDGHASPKDNAEKDLADFLGVASPVSGQNAMDKVWGCWGHLLLAQGRSGENPLKRLSKSAQTDLTNALEASDGGTFALSNTDSHVLKNVNERYSSIYTGAKAKVAAGSDFSKAQKNLSAAHDNTVKCKEIFDAQESRIQNIELLEEKKVDAEKQLQDIQSLLCEAESNLNKIEELSAEMTPFKDELVALDKEKTELEKNHKAILSKKTELEEKEKTLEPLTEEENGIQKSLNQTKEDAEKAQKEYEEADKLLMAASSEEQSAKVKVDFKKASLEKDRLLGEQVKLDNLQRSVNECRQKIGTYPRLEKATVDRARLLAQNIRDANIQRQAQAARIKVVSGTNPVILDGVVLNPGDDTLVEKDVDIMVGDTILHLCLSANSELKQVIDNCQKMEVELVQILRPSGVSDETKLAALWNGFCDDKKALAQAEENLKDFNVPEFEERKKNNDSEFLSAQNALRGYSLADADCSADVRTLVSAWNVAKERYDERREKANDAMKTLQSTEMAIKELNQKLTDVRQRKTDITLGISGLGAVVQNGEQEWGDEAVRTKKIALLEEQIRQKRDSVDAIQAQIDKLNPEQVKSDKEQWNARKNQITENIQQWEKDLVADRTALQTLGVDSPRASLLNAEAKEARAEDDLKRAELDARTSKLLHDVFAEISAQQTRRIMEPLRKAIDPYLQCIFGNSTATVDIQNLTPQNDESNGLIRNGVNCKQEWLSGGAKEQFGVATALAIAEVLAAKHGRKLPIVLDDSFVNTSEDRILNMNRMLAHAEKKGLQVIVFSNREKDYETLAGKRVFML